MAIDEIKREKKLSLFVTSCLVKTNGSTFEREMLAKGTQVIAQQRDGKVEFVIDGKVVSKETAEILCHLISLHPSQASDDDVFGTKERKTVGDSWAVNSVKGAVDLSSRGIIVDAKDIKGSTQLEKVVEVGGTKCLQISAKMEMSNISPSLPKGMSVMQSNASATFSGEFPVDVSARPLSEGMTASIAFVAKGKSTPEAPEITLAMDLEESKHVKEKSLR
ncbi:MAG: hypothetical protein HXX11_21120 [Desulfuromonadales bacterium]|nr:hypothetical protein [Desulfuromonadales bacterium]